MALLVLLAAAARTRIVAADFGFVALDLLDHVVAAGARRARSVRARRRRAGRVAAAATAERPERRGGRRLVHGDLWRPTRRRRADRWRRRSGVAALVGHDRREPPQVADDLLFDAILHRL